MSRDLKLQLVRKHLSPLMKSLDGLKYYFYGGCIRDLYQGKLPNDYDVGCETSKDLQILINRLLELGWVLELETSYGLKFKYLNNIIDISTDIVTSPEDRIEKFDFTINSLAYTSENICVFHSTSFKDIDERVIIELGNYNNPPEVLADRAIKFWKEGYHSKGNKLPPPSQFILSSVYVGEVNHGVFDIR
jgi:tRNA nucleotidyltransferase/poly(A) polymerase|tara:strand:- start:45 stop:614 length:570 start_codon:yes stop_codon:yes gene_type:complete